MNHGDLLRAHDVVKDCARWERQRRRVNLVTHGQVPERYLRMSIVTEMTGRGKPHSARREVHKRYIEVLAVMMTATQSTDFDLSQP